MVNPKRWFAMSIKKTLISTVVESMLLLGFIGQAVAQEHQPESQDSSEQLGISQEALQEFARFKFDFTILEEQYLTSNEIDEDEFQDEAKKLVEESFLSGPQIQFLRHNVLQDPQVQQYVLEHTSNYHEVRDWTSADKEEFANYTSEKMELSRKYRQSAGGEQTQLQEEDVLQLRDEVRELAEESPLEVDQIVRMETDYNLDRDFREEIWEKVQ